MSEEILEVEETSPETAAPPDYEKEEKPALIYDRQAVQKVPLTVWRGDAAFDVAIEMNPLSDEDYFALMEEIPAHAKRVKAISTDFFAPLAEAGKRLAIARHGYREREDWREKTHPHDFVSAISLYLSVSVDENVPRASGLLDDDEDVRILLDSHFSGAECRTSVFFKGWETQSQRDEYLAAREGKPQAGRIASHKRLSTERRLYDLYLELTTGNENYAEGGVPAWHAVAAVEGYFSAQLLRMGKSLTGLPRR